MTEYTSNLSDVLSEKLKLIKELQDNPDIILRAVASAILPELRNRVHVQGKDSEGGQIGTYSPGYMAVRTGNFKNAARITRGPDKGEFKKKKGKGDAGKFTKGFNKIPLANDGGTFNQGKAGINRPVYNRTSDTKVILSLTRQMEQDLSIIDTPDGYGIGYLNPHNFDKALWCEATYGKKILTQLTEGERELAFKTAEAFVPDYIKT